MQNMQSTNNKWFAYMKPNPAARLRLFCLPYAGGSASIYRTWGNQFPDTIEVCPIELPGRGARLREASEANFQALVETLADAITPWLDKPYVLFGHSMGALIGFELARLFRVKKITGPLHFIASGHTAPQIPGRHRPIHNLPDNEFIEELRQLNGTPEAVLNNHELMQLLIPILRADFTINETYVCKDELPLNCPFTVFGGLQDKDVDQASLDAWQQHTTASFSLQMLPGDHFFIQTMQALLIQRMYKELYPYLNGSV